MNFVQRKAFPRFAPSATVIQNLPSKPWDVHNYLGVVHHKAGFFLAPVWTQVFQTLGAGTSDIGAWQQPCYSSQSCHSPEAPIQFWLDMRRGFTVSSGNYNGWSDCLFHS